MHITKEFKYNQIVGGPTRVVLSVLPAFALR